MVTGADQPTRRIDGVTGSDVAGNGHHESYEGLPDADVFTPPRVDELTSPLDLLAQMLSGEVSRPPIRLPVPERAGVSIDFDANIDNDQLTAWRKRALYEDPRDGTDPLKLACIVLANKAIGFAINGKPVLKEGQPLTFASQEVWAMVKPPAVSAIQAVRRLFGVDGHVITAGGEVLRAAGYGDAIMQEDADPTAAR